MTYVKKSIITAVCIALCVVLPIAFHPIPNSGSILLPMHIPVLLCGLIGGWSFGILCGIAGPILSSFITGMPNAAYLPSMVVELSIYGAITGVLMQFIYTKKLYVDLYISLVVALIAGRIVAGITQAFIFSPGAFSLEIWITSYFITALPGLVIQILLLPSIVVALEKSRLISRRYPK